MKLSYALSTLAVAAALSIGSTAFAASPAGDASKSGGNLSNPATDDTGMASLGVDISGAGNTPAQVHAFVSGLPASQQTSVQSGCQSITATPGSASQTVQSFCQNLNSQ